MDTVRKENVTVVTCDLQADGGVPIVYVFKSHLEHQKAIEMSQQLLAQGWIENHDIPKSVAEIIARAYNFEITWTYYYSPEVFR